MSILGDVSGVIGLVKKAKELADELKNIELKTVIVDLQGKLLDLKEEIVELREENARLAQQVKQAPVAALPAKDTVTLRGGLYYKADDGPFCTACYDTGEKFIRVTNATRDEAKLIGIRHKCPVCRATYAD